MHKKISNYSHLITNPKKHLLFQCLQIVLKPMVYEITVFMVGFYPGIITSILHSANTVWGATLPSLNFAVSHFIYGHRNTIYIQSRRDYMGQYQGTHHNYWTSALPSVQNSAETSYLRMKTYKSSTSFWSE